MCVLLHLLICTALRAHVLVVEALYKINYYYYYYFHLYDEGTFHQSCPCTGSCWRQTLLLCPRDRRVLSGHRFVSRIKMSNFCVLFAVLVMCLAVVVFLVCFVCECVCVCVFSWCVF